jgi:hypothetical protein
MNIKKYKKKMSSLIFRDAIRKIIEQGNPTPESDIYKLEHKLEKCLFWHNPGLKRVTTDELSESSESYSTKRRYKSDD